MTSNIGEECFVYITLPGAVSAVTAGKFVIETDPRGDPLGRFVYGRSYLDNPEAVDIDPVELKLAAITYETTRMNGVFGALRDAGPDFWGRRIIEKRAGIAKLREIDYLLESPDDRAGALGRRCANSIGPLNSGSFKKSPKQLSGTKSPMIQMPNRPRTCC
jgi:serine/threonine-protein kinase HipA